MRNEDQNNRYRLLIPDYGDNFRLQYEENDYVHDRPFCAAALAINILNGYKEFKKQNPGFKYPLDRYTPEHEWSILAVRVELLFASPNLTIKTLFYNCLTYRWAIERNSYYQLNPVK